MDKRTLIFGCAALALMALIVVNPAFADAATSGVDAKKTLENVLTGNIGLIIGLAITVAGLWTWIIGQKTGAGIVMIIGGVLITLAPGLFNGARNMLGGAMDQFSGQNLTEVEDTKSIDK